MRWSLLVLLMLAVAGTVIAAAPSGRTPDPVKQAGSIIYADPPGPRQAGDTMAMATPTLTPNPIPSIIPDDRCVGRAATTLPG